MTHKTKILSVFLLLLASAAPLVADPVMALATPDQFGRPLGAVGWTFTLKADPTDWISLIGSFILNESNASVGSYLDVSGFIGGPSNGVLAPGAPDWTSAFNPNAVDTGGIGAYFVDPFQVPGASTSGVIRVLYERFAANPNSCGGDCRIGEGQLDAAFSVTVANAPSAVPEPGATAMLALGAVLAGFRGLRKQGRNRRPIRATVPLQSSCCRSVGSFRPHLDEIM